MAYSKTTWNIGDAITREKMQNIEDGIEALDSGLSTNYYNKDYINTQVNNMTRAISNAQSDANQALQDSHDALLQVTPGKNAWTQVSGAMKKYNEATGEEITPGYSTLADRLNADKSNLQGQINSVVGTSTRVEQWVTAAYQIGTVLDNGIQRAAQSLAEKISDIDRKIAAADSTANSALTILTPLNERTFAERLTAIDANTTPEYNLPTVINEIKTARGTNAQGGNNNSLNDRFTAIETSLSGNTDSIGSLLDNTVKYTDVKNDYTNDTNKPLSAAKGKELRDIIGGTYDPNNPDSSQRTTVTSAIASASSTAEANAKSYTDGLLGIGFNTTDTVAKAIDELESMDTDLDERLDDIEDELTDAHTSSVIKETIEVEDEETHEMVEREVNKTYTSVDARLEAIETHAAAVRTDINTIANELAMVDDVTHNIKDTNTKIDDLTADVAALATEINMGHDEFGRLTGAETRIDDIETAIDHVQGVNDETPNGLKQRITALENTVDTAESGLSARMTSAETAIGSLQTADTGLNNRLNAIDGGNALDTTNGTLGARVSAAESAINTLQNEPKSATVIVEEDCITYNVSTGDPTIFPDNTKTAGEEITPTEDVDYLLGKTVENEVKYFYWKYMGIAPNGHWELISGGGASGGSGSGGGGTSSGVFAATLESITEPDTNTDYFVGNNTIGYTHYRYRNDEFVKILPQGLIKDASVLTTSIIDDGNGNMSWQWPSGQTFSGGLAAYDADDNSNTTNLLEDFIAVRNARINAVYEGDDPNNQTLKSQTLQILDTKGHLMEYPIVGGGGGSAYSIRFLSTMANNTFTVPADDSYTTTITAKAMVMQGNTPLDGVQFTGQVMYRLSNAAENAWINSPIVLPAISNNTEFTVDVSSILATNRTTIVRLMLSINTGDGDPVPRYLDYTITKTQISIASTFDPSAIVTTNNLIVPYTCQGIGLQKTVYFKIDGEDAIQPITTYNHNEATEVSIPLTEYEYGAHRLQIYFMAGSIPSNKLNYYFIYNLDASSNTPIVGLTSAKEEITYGEELVVNYTAYTPGKETTDKVEIKLYTLGNNDEHIIYEDKVDVRTDVRAIADSWKTTAYPQPITPQQGQPEQPITAYIEITAYHYVTTEENGVTSTTTYSDTHYTQVIINRFTNPNNYDFSEVDSRNVLYSYNAYGKTNTDNNRDNYEYVYTANDGNDTEVTFHGGFTGFNWATNGYVDGSSLTISGGAQHTIDVPIFSTAYKGTPLDAQTANDITKYGRTIEIDYEVRSATDLNATIIDCMDPNTHAGLRVTPNYCYLTNQTTAAQVDTKDSFILNESSIAAAYLQTNTRIHLVFVIEPQSQEKAFDKTYHQCVNIYINGEYANSCAYERDGDGNLIDSFTTDATLTFGSDTCILKLYSVKLYNRGLTQKQVLQAYRMAPTLLYDRLTRFADNDVLDGSGYVSYEKAKKRYNCLLLKGPDPTAQATLDWPTISPFKGSKSPAQRKKKETDVEYEGKTESGLIFTKPSSDPNTPGYVEEFNLCDKVPAGAPAYLGAAGAYCSSNNVQGTSSQKYPLHNLKVYLAKWQKEKTETTEVALEPGEEVPEGVETIEKDGVTYKIVTTVTPAQIKKVKYCLKGKDDQGNNLGTEESTFCWKADYMSTDHANTYNANIADGLFSDKLLPDWDSKKYQNTVYGVRCLLFQQQGDDADPVFVGDGTLNNDKGNTKTFGLEYENKTNPELSDDGTDTLRQKWEFTNNTFPLNTFKSDNLFGINEKDSDRKIYAKGAFECSYPDEGDLKDEGLEPNYNHLQLLLTWVNKRACYLDYSVYDEDTQQTTNYTISDTAGTGGTYNGVTYSTERELKKAIFKNEFEQHFNLNHVLTYYIFSEYIALCDNRAKNMFLRSEDIRSEVIRNDQGQIILNGNAYPDDGTLWNQYVNTTTGVTNPSKVDWLSGEGHSTFAKWAPVLYDLDSCFGVENVGLITIKYNADWQYEYNDKKAFSGFDSVFWLMVEDTYADEIRALAKSLYNNDLNFSNFYRQQITGNKNATCPALVNQDMILKYDIPWNEGFINYAEDPDPVTGLREPETPLYKYIQRGTRSTQKATFMRQRSMLLSSKYVSNEFTNSMISFRAGVQVTGNDTLLQLVANQDLYPAIMFGDSNVLVRATHIIQNDQSVEINGNTYMVPAGTPCQITTSQIGNSDTVKIVGASVLNDIGDLSKYQPYELKVGAGANLKRLIIGSNAPGYVNTSTEAIEGLSDCALLEEINVQNTTKLGSLNLGGNGLIKKVYAGGSNITTISLPNGGVLNEIEYGPNTTNITLLNQKFLNTFTYTDNNSHYNLTKLWIENTPNVPIVDIILKALDQSVEPIQGQLRGELKGGIRLVNIDIDLFDPNGTEEENQEALETTTQFLSTLVSTVIKGRRLDSTGTLSSNKELYPYISGQIHITSIRASLLSSIREKYPDLHIYSSRGVNGEYIIEPLNEYTITYVNYDRDEDNPLFVDHKVRGEVYLDPVVDIDEITGRPYINFPEKPEDAHYVYRFGTYAENEETGVIEYQKYSGWVRKGTTNTHPRADDEIQDVVFIATYPIDSAITKQYTVRWFDGINADPRLTYTEDYGTEVGTYDAPEDLGRITRVQTVGTTVKVFKGWNRPVGRLTENIDVYAQWEESTLDGNAQDIDMSTLNAADLYALSRIGNEDKHTLLNSKLGTEPILVPMGHDFNYTTGVNTTDLLNGASKITFSSNTTEAKIYDGAHAYNGSTLGEVRPLSVRESDWTLALDYKFLLTPEVYNSSREYVLASCYQDANSSIQGFKVSLVKNNDDNSVNQSVQVSWGTNKITIDYLAYDPSVIQVSDDNTKKQVTRTYRNMIVLRHKADQPDDLFVYYALPDTSYQQGIQKYGYGAEYSLSTNSTTLTWSNSTTIDTPLILGGNYRGATTTIENNSSSRCPAKAIVYWGKFWDTDLGEKNCNMLVSWPHETVPFYLAGYTGVLSPQRQILANTNLTFVAAQGIGDRYLFARTGDLTTGNIATWQYSRARRLCNNRIYKALPVSYQSIIKQTTIESSYINANNSSDIGTVETEDFLYLPTEREVSNDSISSVKKDEIQYTWNSPWPWMSAPEVHNVYVFDENSTTKLVLKEVDDINTYRYRFSGRYITPTARIYDINVDPYRNNNTWGYANGQIKLQSGDVWINGGVPYMYFTNAEINEGIYVDLTNNGGGWKKADIWNLRTYDITAQYGAENKFERVEDTGDLTLSPGSTSAREYGRLLCPEFSI